MVLVSEMASRSGLKPDQLAAELPNAFARLTQMRKEIEEFRRLMENEPGIAPFVEIAAAAGVVGPPARPAGRRPGAGAGAGALRRGHAPAHRRRSSARAATAPHCPSSAATSPRPSIARKDAAGFYLAAAKDTPAADPQSAARRFAMAGGALFVHGDNFFANDESARGDPHPGERGAAALREDRRDRRRQKRIVAASKAIVLATIADAQTKLGGRLPGYRRRAA